LGLPLHSLTADEAVDAIESLILSGGTHQVATANLDFWLNSLADPHLHRIIAGCSLVLPDGMPLVWASKLLGCPLAGRVTGVDLVPRLAELSARKGYGIFLLGGKGDVAERAAELLERNYPGARIVGTCAPSEESMAQPDHSEIVHRIQAAKPDILLVALGNPKQEKWIWRHRKRLGVPVAIGVGGSFEMLVGNLRRAPAWIQRLGLEWAMRLVQEPSRLGPRYLRDFVGLARRLPLTLLTAWMQRPYSGQSYATTVTTPQAIHIHVHGKLCSELASALQEATDASIANGLVEVVYLQEVRQVTAAGLGVLMDLRRQLLDAGLTLSLTGLSFSHHFILYGLCALPLFDEWQAAAAQNWSQNWSLILENEAASNPGLQPDLRPELSPELSMDLGIDLGMDLGIDMPGERDALRAQTSGRG
jgi:N-acetylglucosaminyldiphosphoundecaprenol N-acetyl-beta-D-mannosaminyltransferase